MNLLILVVLGLACLALGQTTNSTLLWPMPQSITTGAGTASVSASSFAIKTSSSSDILAEGIKRYLNLIFPWESTPKSKAKFSKNGPIEASGTISSLQITVNSNSEDLYFGVDESYSLTVPVTGSAQLNAATVFGALHGLETFSQLVLYDSSAGYYINSLPIMIQDAPRFAWRGFLMDTARHYQTVSTILRQIDVLSYNKMNVLHWHAVDAQSFPIESPTYPDLAEAGAWAPEAVYTTEDIEGIVQYGLYRGVRVVPEFDIPGHAASWGLAYPNLTVTCPDYAANINNIPLEPTQEFTLPGVAGFLGEMRKVFTDDFLHLGGDEVVFGCWQENAAVTSWMQQHNIPTVTALESYFEQNVYKIANSLNRTMIVWQEIFNNGVVPSKDVIVQVWKNDGITGNQVVSAGYKAIFSFAWYLDQQIPDPPSTHYEWVDTWQDFYLADPYKGITGDTSLIQGGEACMWAEQVDSTNYDSRVWPRTCGVSERLWSPQSVNSVALAIPRLVAFRCRLAQRNIGAGPIAPDYCPLPATNFFAKMRV